MAAPIDSLPLLASPKMAAEVMGLTEPQVRELLHEQRLAHVRIGKRRMIPRDAIESFISGNKVKPKCQDETQGRGSASSISVDVITSPGPEAAAVGSAARARQIANKLKSPLPDCSTYEPAAPGRVIPLKCS